MLQKNFAMVLIAIKQLAAWKSHADLEHFMAHNYRPFLTAISPLNGADSSPLIPLSYPYIMQLHPGMPSLELGAVSALYELSFNAGHDADVKTELAIETQLCRNLLLDAAQEVGDGDRFLGMDAVWVERYGPPPPSSSSPTATDSAFSKRADEREQILLVITEWTNQHVEKTMLDSGRIEESRGGQALTIGEYFAKNILQRACTYTKHDVVFENVLPSNSQWLDKGEKWSTYVARLLAEGEQRRGDEGAAEPRI